MRLVRLPLMPPLLARSGSDTQLSDLEAQEALLEARQEAASQMTRFVGGQITRHYWGGFTLIWMCWGGDSRNDGIHPHGE